MDKKKTDELISKLSKQKQKLESQQRDIQYNIDKEEEKLEAIKPKILEYFKTTDPKELKDKLVDLEAKAQAILLEAEELTQELDSADDFDDE